MNAKHLQGRQILAGFGELTLFHALINIVMHKSTLGVPWRWLFDTWNWIWRLVRLVFVWYVTLACWLARKTFYWYDLETLACNTSLSLPNRWKITKVRDVKKMFFQSWNSFVPAVLLEQHHWNKEAQKRDRMFSCKSGKFQGSPAIVETARLLKGTQQTPEAKPLFWPQQRVAHPPFATLSDPLDISIAYDRFVHFLTQNYLHIYIHIHVYSKTSGKRHRGGPAGERLVCRLVGGLRFSASFSTNYTCLPQAP